MKRSQSRKLRQQLLQQQKAGGDSFYWKDEAVAAFIKMYSDIDKQNVIAHYTKKYGYLLPVLWAVDPRPLPRCYIVTKGESRLRIRTCIYRYTLPVGFVNIETAQTWADKVGGSVDTTFNHLVSFFNGEKLEELDTNWKELQQQQPEQ